MNHLISSLLLVIISVSLYAQEPLKAGDLTPRWHLQREDLTSVRLNDIEAEYVLLLFWHYKCGHCQNALNKIDRFLEKEQPQNLQIVSIYSFLSEQEKFWSFVKDPNHFLTDSIYLHTTDYRAMTRRAFRLKGSPPFLVLLRKDGTIINIGFKAKKLKKIWKEVVYNNRTTLK